MSDEIVVFRGCSRLEYRNQNIKILRAVEGEHTRASYRSLWVTDEVRDILDRNPNPIVTAVFIDADNRKALPIRQMMVIEHKFEADRGLLHLTFEISSFLGTMLDFTDDLTAWGGSHAGHPPTKFVARWDPSWPGIRTLPKADEASRWREAIDFLTQSWEFPHTGFMRFAETTTGEALGPTIEVPENQEFSIRLDSYNPHLNQAHIGRMRLRASQSGGLMAIDPDAGLAIPRDGELMLKATCLEAGAAQLELSIDPDPQFSTYLPIKLSVTADEGGTGRPRILGREWQECLEELNDALIEKPEIHLIVLGLLDRAFPDDPSVLRQLGHVFYRREDLARARKLFDRALELREDSHTVAWNLFAALRRGDVADARELITRLNLSRHELFDELVSTVEALDESINLQVAKDIPEVFGDDKALRLLLAMGKSSKSENAACELASSIRVIDPERSLDFLLEQLSGRAEWGRAVHLLVEIADETNRHDGVSEYVQEILLWGIEPPMEFKAKWSRYERLIPTPEIKTGLLLTNARRMFASHVDCGLVASEFSINAAEVALKQGWLQLVNEALTLVFANLEEADDESHYHLDRARELEQRLGDVLRETLPFNRQSDEYLRSMYLRLRPWTERKVLLVLGSYSRPSDADIWESELRVRVEWVPSTPSNPINEDRVRSHDPTQLIVVALWEHMGHIKENTKQWIKKNHVPFIQMKGTGGLLVENLLEFFEVPPAES